jgi:hypothetical protein
MVNFIPDLKPVQPVLRIDGERFFIQRQFGLLNGFILPVKYAQ